MFSEARNLYRYRELLWMLSLRDIKIRYKQSVMGFMWALLMPLMIVAAGVVVRIVISNGGGASAADLASVVVKSLAWAFFVASLRFASNSLTGNSNLVSKVAFPKEVFPLAAVAASFFDLTIAASAGALILAFVGGQFSVNLLWVPVLVVALVLLTAGICLFLSALNLFYRDVKYIVEVVLTFAIFFTPVLYDASMLGNYRNIAMLNPVAPILENLRSVVVLGTPPDTWFLYSAGFAVVMLYVGYAVFKKLEYRFAESI